MNDDTRKNFVDVLQVGEEIQNFVRGMDFKAYQASSVTQRANRTKQHVPQRKLDCVRLDHVGGTHRAGTHPIGFRITDKLSLAQIELQVPLQLLADVCGQADIHGSIHDFRIRHRGSA